MAKASLEGADDIAQLKKLPIAYVLEQAGVEIVPGDGMLHAACPFHDDSDPSFDVFGEQLERWGCFPCGLGGDVLDLVQRLNGFEKFGQAAKRAAEMAAELVAEGWTGPTVGVKRTLDLDAIRDRVNNARLEQMQRGALENFLAEKAETNPGLIMEAEWLREAFGLGEEGASIVIPYWNRHGALITLKHRTSQSKALSAPGSSFGEVLYGEWADVDPTKPVLLCEGESDVWAAAYAVYVGGLNYSVLGLPTGAGAHPKQAALLAGRAVTLAFDADKAGKAGAHRWHSALLEHKATVKIARLGDGYDLAKLAPAQIIDVLSRAVPILTPPKGILISQEGYFRPGKEENTPISNWTFVPDRELIGEHGSAFEGTVQPLGRRATLSHGDLENKTKIIRWSARNGGAWYGSELDAQRLLGTLEADSPWLRVGNMSHVAGLHQGHFIWPEGSIGPDYWLYVPPAADIHIGDMLTIEPGPWSVKTILRLRDLHETRVMDPLLAWLAVAPLRSLLREFPILAITGSSGSGKTTLVESVMKAFAGSRISLNLTSTTRHVLQSYAASTNAFPVHFDEYRPGARTEALEALRQILRDAFTEQASAKGGMGEQWAEVRRLATGSPIIVTGEDAFEETSHIERMVLLPMPIKGKNTEAMAEVRGWKENGLPHAYLTWLHAGLRDGWITRIYNYEVGPEELHPRQRLSLGVLDLGWKLLNDFIMANGGEHLGEPDFGRVIGEALEGGQSSPIRDAILWALDEPDALEFLFRKEGTIFMRIPNFVEYVIKHKIAQLPGGQKAVQKYIVEHYGAHGSTTVKHMGRAIRAWGFPASAIGE